MPQQRIACPQCRQPIVANVEQLFDATADPRAKQILLSGAANVARCQTCGYEGPLATPIIYHDNEKELLLTFFPPELAMPVNEQERLVGPLIKQITDSLPMERRKGYLLKPQTFFTFQSMIERILGEDGITPEMLKGQQDRVNIVEKLLGVTSEDARKELIKQNAELFDDQFFALFGQLTQAAAASGQNEMAQQMAGLEKILLEETEYGQHIQAQLKEMEAASQSLQDLGETLTRDSLLDLLVDAPNEAREQALVSMARGGLDYQFFQILTDRTEAENDPEAQAALEALRERLLEYVNEIDKQIAARLEQAQGFLNELLQQEDIAGATRANIRAFDQQVVQVLETMLREATEAGNQDQLAKLQQVVAVLQEASGPLPEYEFIEELLATENAEALEKLLAENEDKLTDELLQTLGGIVAQAQGQEEELSAQDQEMFAKMEAIYGAVLKFQMKKNMGS